MSFAIRVAVFSLILIALVRSSPAGEKQDIEAILIHPPYAESYSCSEHRDGQFAHLGDALGADCTIAKLVEVDGRLWMRSYSGDGRQNEDWFGWQAAVLAPCDCKVVNLHINPETNDPGILGKPPSSSITFERPDGTRILVAHIAEPEVSVGEEVTSGQVVATVGNNGYSRQPHVHIAAWRDQEAFQLRFDQKKMASITSIAKHPDDPELRILYEADQAARSQENIEKGLVPTLQEERDRRFAVFQMLSEGKLRTANDFFRAGLILHHTGSIQHIDGHTESLGTESKVLAFYLFQRAHELGHESGRTFMAAAYNYYLDACGEDAGKFGYAYEDGEPVWRPTASEAEYEVVKCGMDPRPYLDSPNAQPEAE